MNDARPEIPLAHSAKDDSSDPDAYDRHVSGTVERATTNCKRMLEYATSPPAKYLETVVAAATFHDLGKLDDQIQDVLSGKQSGRLKWDHIDAGVSHLSSFANMSAWLVRAHHSPGLPSKKRHFNKDCLGRKLRGRRKDSRSKSDHDAQIARTDKFLSQYLKIHESVLGEFSQDRIEGGSHGLEMRLALSCLVDADHSDTAYFDTGSLPAEPCEPRWKERLESLKRYVSGLPKGESESETRRNKSRQDFFNACINYSEQGSLFACEGPVGIGKTTAIAGLLLQLAIRKNLRRIVIVAPYTNILLQTAQRLRKALVLDDENDIADRVIVEEHHRADFSNREARSLASLWNAPIVLTTAVSFFETLSACDPATLRKFHALPGSAVFLDEAHAALPVQLWPQNWKWVNRLASNWSCNFVLASGTLTRFWEDEEVVEAPTSLPELVPADQREVVFAAEKRRVSYCELGGSNVVDVATLSDAVIQAPGPRLVILNTVQNAAIVARYLRSEEHDTLHLSTALTPAHRARIYNQVVQKLNPPTDSDWTLVATSCVEAGVDFSFRTAFRERFSVASILQVGGRVNRNSEYERYGGSLVYDFALSDTNITQHPAAKESARVLQRMMSKDLLNTLDPSSAASQAMREEISTVGGLGQDALIQAETIRDYPAVKELGRVINADTRLVVVSESLKSRLKAREKVGFRELLEGSVQLWAHKIFDLKMKAFDHLPDVYQWNDAYDADFLGYMEGVLKRKTFLNAGGGVV